MENKKQCRDKTYPTEAINFSECYSLNDSVKAKLSYANTDQIPLLEALVEQAAERGDNVGMNEFRTLFMSEYFFNASEIITVTDLTSSNIEAFIAVHPCLYSRGFDSCIASIHLILSDQLAAQPGTHAALLGLAEAFVAEMRTGYTQVCVDVALCCVGWMSVLKRQGFHACAIVPRSVEMKGVGFTENVILMKSLGLPARKPRTGVEVLNMLRTARPSEDFMQTYPSLTLPQIDFLPQTHYLNCGITAICRNVRKTEDELMYSSLTTNSGDTGFATHEFPSLDHFRRFFLAENYCALFEEASTRKIIAFVIISESWLTRGNSKTCESDMFVVEEFRGRGLASEIVALELGIAKELGYTAVIEECFMNNVRMIAAGKRQVNLIGVLPNAGYIKGIGWEDTIIGYADISEKASFSQLVQDAKSRCKSKL